jgi:hypothetical protein
MNKYHIGDIFVSIPSFTLGEDERRIYTVVSIDLRRNNQYFYQVEFFRKQNNSYYSSYEHEHEIDRWISNNFVKHYPVVKDETNN